MQTRDQVTIQVCSMYSRNPQSIIRPNKALRPAAMLLIVALVRSNQIFQHSDVKALPVFAFQLTNWLNLELGLTFDHFARLCCAVDNNWSSFLCDVLAKAMWVEREQVRRP